MKRLVVAQSAPAGCNTLLFLIIQNAVALPMSFLTTVLSQSKSANGAPSSTSPAAPHVPNSVIMASNLTRLSPYHARLGSNAAQDELLCAASSFLPPPQPAGPRVGKRD